MRVAVSKFLHLVEVRQSTDVYDWQGSEGRCSCVTGPLDPQQRTSDLHHCGGAYTLRNACA